MFAKLPSLNALRAFEALARHLSYTKAAQELSVTPAAVKQLVAKLEASLGAQLVQRTGRDLMLTEAGRAGQTSLAEGFRHMVIAVDEMRPSPSKRRLVVSAEPFFAASWLVPRLNRFKEIYDGVDVLIDSSMGIANLERGDADIAIRYGAPKHPDLATFRLFEDRIFIVCSPRLVNDAPRLKFIGDLRKTTLLHWDLSHIPQARETARWFSFSNWLEQANAADLEPLQNLYFSDYNQAIQAAIAGHGVVLGSWPILRDTVEAGLLMAPFENAVSTNIGYDMVATKQALALPEVEHFKTWLLDEAKAQPGWLGGESR